MSNNLNNLSKKQFLEKFAEAIYSENYESFCELTQKGVIWFDESTVETLLNKDLPMILEINSIPTLLKYIAGDKNYIDIVRSLLAEIIKVLHEEKFILGEDFSYGEIDGTPSLWIKDSNFEKIEKLYQPHSWRQCLPYIKKLETN